MMNDCHDDPVLRHVSRLPGLVPDPRRAARVRARCRATLTPPVPDKRRPLAPMLLAGLCLLYLSAIVHDVLRLQGVL